MLDAALLIALLLSLPIGLHGPRVLLAVLFLVVRMFVPPLLLAFADDLAIQGVSLQLFAVIVSSSMALTGRLAADNLLGSVDAPQTVAARNPSGRGQPQASRLLSG
jgi:hypothetical protein